MAETPATATEKPLAVLAVDDEAAKLALASRLDPLTGVLNHGAWVESITLEHERALRDGGIYSVMMIGLDHFKALNDSQGHQAGDACLQKLAQCLLRACCALESVGRYGGEEFVVLLRETGLEGAQALAEHIRKAVSDSCVPHSANPVAERVTVSVGVASAPANRWEDVVKQADEALHTAKALGRNMVWTQESPRHEAESVAPEPEQALTVLVIDDDAGDAELLRRHLEQIPNFAFHFVHCSSGEAGRAELGRRHVGAVFLDYRLGAESGLDTLKCMRSAGYLGPVIVVTGQGDEYVVADLMRAGADDYVAKTDLGVELLQRALHNAENRHLERKTEARNKQLLTELQSTKKSLEGTNNRLAELYKTAHQFVDNVSHEFRTPLTVIKEFTSILRDGLAGDLTAEQREYLDLVLNRTDDLTTMVDDMLDISKLEAGVLGVSRRNCGMLEIISKVRTTLERKALAAKVKLEISADDGLPSVYCDPEKIGRVLINLTVNALKFCEENGHVAVQVSRQASDSCVRVSVTDDGRGIAPEDLQAIFERFKQIEGHVRSSTKGFGLGLSIAKELVQLNFGEITVDSKLGSGSTFSFTIPTAQPSNVLALYLKRSYSSPLALLSATIKDAVDRARLDEVEQFLQRQLRRSDLLFRRQPNTWLVVAAAGAVELGQMASRLERARAQANRNRPSGALPRIHLEVKGSWRGLDQSRELMRRFELEFQVAGDDAAFPNRT
jgi:diguanylate cyclase (GGDEF)-like protein